jgi:hypothetical protein
LPGRNKKIKGKELVKLAGLSLIIEEREKRQLQGYDILKLKRYREELAG